MQTSSVVKASQLRDSFMPEGDDLKCSISKGYHIEPKGDHYNGSYTPGVWNYDYNQKAKKCPPCSTEKKCGPYCWSSVNDPAKNQCGNKEQTPINIVTKDTKKNSKLEFPVFYAVKGGCNEWNQFVDDHSYEVEFSPECKNLYLSYKDVNYTLAQFHFHFPSEHTVNGKKFDGELHMVHKSTDGGILVLGVLMTVQKKLKTSILDRLINPTICAGREAGYPKGKELSNEYRVTSEVPFNVYHDILPKSKKVYNYPGSLTTFGCTEGVKWFVFDQALPITAKIPTLMRTAVGGQPNTITLKRSQNSDNRPVQPLNDRVVERNI